MCVFVWDAWMRFYRLFLERLKGKSKKNKLGGRRSLMAVNGGGKAV